MSSKMQLQNIIKLPIKDKCTQEHLTKLLMARNHKNYKEYFKVQKIKSVNQKSRKNHLKIDGQLTESVQNGPDDGLDANRLKSHNETNNQKSEQERIEKMMQDEIKAARQILESVNSDIESSNSSVSNSRKAHAEVVWDKFDYDWRKDQKNKAELNNFSRFRNQNVKARSENLETEEYEDDKKKKQENSAKQNSQKSEQPNKKFRNTGNLEQSEQQNVSAP